MKTTNDFFADWESHVFGYGYGTGEPHVLLALKRFFAAIPEDGTSYEYDRLEEACTPQVAWLLINALARADVIEYGTSPRFGWLTRNGKALADFVRARALSDLVKETGRDENYDPCYPDHCNCGEGDCRKLNPFWPRRNI